MHQKQRNSWTAVSCGVLAAFAAYFCMYAYRKPFTVGMYRDYSLWGIDYKIVLIVSQVIGYTLSKFRGIKVIAEMPSARRLVAMFTLVALAELALVLFGLVAPPYNFVFLFLNGIPLGLMWGLVFSFLEGRRATELLGAVLCVSFIVSSGVVKSAGRLLMTEFGVSEFWMPAATGALFAVPFALALWGLSRMPPPSAEDEQLRTRRVPMNAAQRKEFFRRYALGICLLVGIYVLLSIYRDFRDNFAMELWKAVGFADAPAIFTVSEIPVAILTLALIGALCVIKDNRRAFWVSLVSIALGGLMTGLATLGYRSNMLAPVAWMIAVGIGMYVPYIAFHVMVFERLIAVTRKESNIGFLMYIADAFGYLGSIAVMLFRNFGARNVSWLDFFVWSSYAVAVGTIALTVAAAVYFQRVWHPDHQSSTLKHAQTVPSTIRPTLMSGATHQREC